MSIESPTMSVALLLAEDNKIFFILWIHFPGIRVQARKGRYTPTETLLEMPLAHDSAFW